LRAGNFEGFVAAPDPDVVVRIDQAAARPGAPRVIRGAKTWAKGQRPFAQLVQPMLVNGQMGLM
jgi:hypothetical protein